MTLSRLENEKVMSFVCVFKINAKLLEYSHENQAWN